MLKDHIVNLNHNLMNVYTIPTVIPTRGMVTLLVHMGMPNRKMKTPLKDMEITPEIMTNAQQLQKLNY